MCGIYGYIGTELACPIILDGLRMLEYRGYDSWGLVTLNDIFHTKKNIGCLDETAEKFELSGNIGIGHVRWATSGIISKENAHPHFDCNKEIAIVHNGIIFNEINLRSKLNKHKLISETDTELFAHLLEENAGQNQSFIEDIIITLRNIDAHFAFLILRKGDKKIYAIRNKSPVHIGIGNSAYHVSSDIRSFVGKAEQYMDLEDGDIAEIGIEGFKIYDSNMNLITRELKPLNLTPEIIDKGIHPHFYIKEIKEIKSVVKNIIQKYITANTVDFGSFINEIKGFEKIILTGAGSSYFASMVGEYYLVQLLGDINVESILSSELELKYANITFPRKTILIALSQSGETKDTLDAIKFAKQRSITVVSLINNPDSEAEKYSDYVIKLLCGLETSVPATKTFVAELLVLLLFSISISENEKKIEILDEIKRLPETIDIILNDEFENIIKELTEKYYCKDAFYPLSRGIIRPVALEAGRKIEEILYLQTFGTSMGSSAELKHGPLTMVKKKVMLFLVPLPTNEGHHKIIANIHEVKVRDAKIIVIATQGDEEIVELNKVKCIDDVLWIPKSHELLAPIIYIIPLYLLTYCLAIMNKINPDRPRNLAKTLTVD